MPQPKSEFENTTGGHIGAMARGSNNQMVGISVKPNQTVWLDEDEQIATANAPRDDANNPFEGDPPPLKLVTSARDVVNRRRIGDSQHPQVGDEEPEAPAPGATEDKPSDAEGAAPAATEEPPAASAPEPPAEPAEKPESEMTEEERNAHNAKAAAARAIPPAAPPKPPAKPAKPAAPPKGERAPTEQVGTPAAEGK